MKKTAEDGWRISIAAAGFSEDDLNVEVRENNLIVQRQARRRRRQPQLSAPWHRHPARFERRFHLADHVKVTGASYVSGMLNIDLVREVPEALKPRTIQIAKGETVEAKVVEKKKKAA